MIDFLSGDSFRFLWLPIITTVLTLCMKVFHKDRLLKMWTWSDFAVASNLMVTAVFIFLIKLSFIAAQIKNNTQLAKERMDQFMSMSMVFVVFFVGMLLVTWVMREKGWHKNSHGDLFYFYDKLLKCV